MDEQKNTQQTTAGNASVEQVAKGHVDKAVASMKQVPSKEEFNKFDFMKLFHGRLSRTHNAYFIVASIVLNIIGGMLGIIGALVSFALMVLGIGVTIRRLHDINLSGWYYLLPLVLGFFAVSSGISGGMMGMMGGGMRGAAGLSFILALIAGFISLAFFLYVIFRRGDQTSNQYGEVPRSDTPFIKTILNI